MSIPLIVLDLQAGRKLETVCYQYKLLTSRHAKYPNLVGFKYSQRESPMKEKLVRECRGLILDEADDWRVVARPFDKFFNYGEALAATIDWANAKVLEKLDGTLCILYYYDEGWHVATTGSVDASGKVGDSKITFKELFWQTFMDLKLTVPATICRNYTFMFELMTPYNKVVCNYGPKNQLKLIGIRQRFSGFDTGLSQYKEYPSVASYPLTSIEEILSTFDQMEPLLQEGYVVVDNMGNRIKIKHPGYVALHHMKAHFSVRYLVDLARKAEIAEVIAYFPEWSDLLLEVQISMDDFEREVFRVYEAYKAIPIQKDFALAVAPYPWSGVLFGLRSGKIKSIKEWIADVHIDTLISLLRIKPKLEEMMLGMGIKENDNLVGEA